MRLFAIAMLLMVATSRAEACPHSSVCVVAGTREAISAVRETRPRTLLQLAISELEIRDALAISLRRHVVATHRGVEMPWVWQVLRREVYGRMPRYVEPRFSLVLSPVVVESPQDTVPGVGLEGAF